MSAAVEPQSRYWVDGIKYRAPDHPVSLAYARPKCDLIRQYSGLPDGSSALDVGTGNGTLFLPLSRFFSCMGLDLSLHLLRGHCAPGRILRGNAARLPFKDRSFDLVAESCLLHHAPDPRAVVAEMTRIARAAFCLIEPNTRNPLSFAFHALVPEERGALRLGTAALRTMVPPDFKVRFAGAVGLVFPTRTPQWLLPLLAPFDRPCRLGNVNVLVALRRQAG